MISFGPTEEQELVRETVREFAISEMREIARECDESGQIAQDLLDKTWELGLVNGDTDAGGDEDLPAFQHHRGLQSAQDTVGHPGRIAAVPNRLHEDAEFVPAQACGHVTGSNRVRDPPRHLDEELVSGRMPHGVVHHLEAVEIEHQER